MDCGIDVVGYLNLHEFGNLLSRIVKGGGLCCKKPRNQRSSIWTIFEVKLTLQSSMVIWTCFGTVVSCCKLFSKNLNTARFLSLLFFAVNLLGPFSIDVCLHSKVMGFSEELGAFSYLLLCSDVEYDVKLLSQLWAQLTADSGRAQLI